ncbi:kinase-like protein [Dendrothele bispora CBS 962.96]|uniref:1-phosphatidylinositol 4-kinase n=1 Tax=Dendrothele bispora (strain CBS 962.96) TaxID=1314807 RepID=A0A4S8LP32_DENBC|nr:kinase-like protein [Dendrothele bispora CBS 962.96]
MASHALLLRLFLTPSFFSVHVALQYLAIYADNIGITYYITRRLRELDVVELRDAWGFICHLLLTRPSRSRALECFVVDIAQRSTHIAMITLWFMQAALKDLSNSPHNSPQFMTCQRVLHRCHEIIFGDLPQTVVPYSTISLPFQSRFMRKKVKHHRDPAIIGVGMVLAGAPALPQLTEIMGQVAIEQGRVEETGSEERSIESRENLAAGTAPKSNSEFDENQTDGDGEGEGDEGSVEDVPATEEETSTDPLSRFKPSGLARRSSVGPAQTAPTLPLHLHGIRRSRNSEDPLGQLDADQASTPYQSSPSISASHPPRRAASLNFADTILQRYDFQSQIHLLKSNYCRAEVSFLLTLENISDRLLVVPRPARVSALRAELTSLNHKLPAEVCMPMWCNSSDLPQQSSQIPHPHHRIVRVPPGESVVLNSAERAPYLLYIEILHDELDFDPQKRGNKDLLKKIILKENERSGASREIDTFSTVGPTPSRLRKSSSIHDVDVDVVTKEKATSFPTPLTITPPTPTSATEEEEMDLVEQLYGVDQSLRSQTMDLSDSIVLPPPPKNKDLDMVAWSRPSSIPASPLVDDNNRVPSPLPQPPPTSDNSYSLSLDEYSERMRTAAIMLAQLNANLVRESVNSAPPQESSSGGPLSWIPGSTWLSGSTDETPKSAAPVLTGSGSGSQDFGKPPPSRMRLQASEASAIRDRIMQEMLALEEERMAHMRENRESESMVRIGDVSGGMKTAEDESIIRRELSKADPSAMVFSESWATKKSRIRHSSPYGHLASWDCVSAIVKTGADLRQEQLAVQLIKEFQRIWEEENCSCWVRYFRILITGATSGLVETITDAVSIHSIKKSEYARRLAEGRLGHVTLFDHFKNTYGDPSSAKFVRAQRNFAKSLAGYSVVTYLLQIKDRHNGNILLDSSGHLIHIDFGFMLANTPGNLRFEAAPFKLPLEYIELLGGLDGAPFLEFRKLFREGFEAARKHCERIITIVELMQKDSTLPCFAIFGEQTAAQLRDRFQPALSHSAVAELVDRLIDSSAGSSWTRLYDSFQYYSQSIL